MKRIWLGVTALLLVTAAIAFFWRQFSPCTKLNSVEEALYCWDLANRWKTEIKLAARFSNNETLSTAARALEAFGPFRGEERYLLGLNQNRATTYLLLLQNDNELRANGGFFGSYSVVSARDGQFDIRFQDIYVPDGQLQGHVEPPPPIQQAFGQGWWKLRDADWYPDFPSSAQTIRWFFTAGKEVNPDFLLTLNLKTIQLILKIMGPIEIKGENLTVTGENIFEFLQTRAEVGFFPGSTQKKDALTAIGNAFLARLQLLDHRDRLAILNLFLDQLEKKNLLIHAQRPELEDLLRATNWAGQLQPEPCAKTSCLNDTLAVVESNLGANKANCCTQRLTEHIITVQNGFLVHRLRVTYHNSSQSENPLPPEFYGGNYIQYLRFYLPADAQLVEITAQPTLPTTLTNYPLPMVAGGQPDISDRFGFREYGFFHLTRAGSSSSVELSYSLPLLDQRSFQLSLRKQSGLESSPQVINLFGREYRTNLDNDFQAQITLP